MSTREAALKVTLRRGSFQSGLRNMENDVKRSGSRMGATLKRSLGEGVSAAKSQIGGMMSTIQSGLKTAATLGGAISAGAFIKDAVKIQNTYRNIAFNVNKVAGNSLEWQDVQQMITSAVDKTGRSAEDLAGAFMEVFEATGNLEFSRKSLDIIGTSATATGHSMEALATTAQLAFRKFNVGADDVDDAMTRMIEKTGVGGKGIEQLSSRFALVAGEAANAGMHGAEGISELLGMLLLLDSSIGEKADPGLKMMFQTIKAGSSSFVRMKKELGRGVRFDADMTALEKFKALLSSSKGRKAAEMIFTADARVVFDELAKPFDKAMEEAKERGLSKADALKAGLEAFDKNIADASVSTMKFSQIQNEANRRLKTDPMIKFQLAVEKVREAFATPKMIGALDKLGDKLPVFADAVADVVDHILDNPWETIATVVAAKIGLAFASTAVTSAIASGARAMFAGQAAAAAASAGGGALASGGSAVAAGAAGAAGSGAAVAGGIGAGGAALAGAVGVASYLGFSSLFESTGADKTLMKGGAALSEFFNPDKARAEVGTTYSHMRGVGAGAIVARENAEIQRSIEMARRLRDAQRELTDGMSTLARKTREVNSPIRGPAPASAPVPGARPVGG